MIKGPNDPVAGTILDRKYEWINKAGKDPYKPEIYAALESAVSEDNQGGEKSFVFNALPAQIEMFNAMNNRKRGVMVVHRRGGKTTALCWYLFTQAWQADPMRRSASERPLFFFVAPTEKMAASLAGPAMEYFCAVFGATFKRSSNEVHIHHNKAVIKLLGASNRDSLRGQGPWGVVLDEYAYMSPEVWTTILQPAVGQTDGFAFFSSTPHGHDHFYELFKMAYSKPKEWASVFLPNSLTNQLPQKQVDEIKETSPFAFEQEINCNFDAPVVGSYFGELIVKARNAGRITSIPHDPTLPVITAWDLGFRDNTAIWFFQVARTGAQLNVINYMTGSRKSMQDWVKSVMAMTSYHYALHIFPHDAAAHEYSNGISRLAMLRDPATGLQGDCHLITKAKSKSVEDGIDRVRRILPQCFFDAEKTRKGLASLELYQCRIDNKGRPLDVPLKNSDSHAADAFRMAATFFAGKLNDPTALQFDMQSKVSEDMTARALTQFGEKKPRGFSYAGDLINPK